MKLFIASMLMSLVLAGFPCQAEIPPLTPLRERVQRYHRYFSQHRYDLMWKMSSQDLRKKNGYDEKGYVQQFREYGFGKVQATILNIDLDVDRARVRVKLIVWSKPDKKWFTEVEDEVWIFEKGQWFFEDHRVAESVG